MNRTFIAFGTLASIVGLALAISSSGRTQLGVAKNYVQIQSTTPGTAQSGHSNVSGTSRAGQFVGGGAGLTGVNADLLDGLNSTAFLTGVPNPLVLSGTTTNGIIQVTQTGTADYTRGIFSQITAPGPGPNAQAIAGLVLGSGSNGTGVVGAHEGGGIGVLGESNTGIGVRGVSLSTGVGVSAFSSSGIGLDAFSNGGPAIKAEAGGGHAVQAIATATAGVLDGVRASSSSPAGAGVRAINLAPGGIALQTLGVSFFEGSLRLAAGNGIGIATSTLPQFPLDFNESLGNKISLWGTSPTAHYGFGIQDMQLQIFTPGVSDNISFGYGGSGAFLERARFTDDATLWFLPNGFEAAAVIQNSWDIALRKDQDNDSNDEWFRFLTNGGAIEQLRILANDEATALFDGVVTANGIDYAEAFKVYDPTLEPGDLVINAGNNWEYIGRSMTPYDNGVIGVISTKPAFLAGLSFDAEEKIDPALTQRRDDARRKGDEKLEKALTMQMRKKAEEAHRPVAFMGRVPVKVVGAVKVGDHLTASHIPGVAMAMTQPGHSIGIALEASSGGQAKVMGMIQPRYYGGTIAARNELAEQVKSMRSEIDSLKVRLSQVDDLKAEIRELRKLVQESGRRR